MKTPDEIRAKKNAYMKEWYASQSPEKKQEIKDRATLWNKTKRKADYMRWSALMRKYGLTQEQYNQLLLKQNGHCALCPRTGADCKYGVLDVDHKHGTKVVRGLLCNRCNTLIGRFGDDANRLTDAAQYIAANEPMLRMVV